MIGSFKYKALEQLYTDDNRPGLPPELVEPLQLILSVQAHARQILKLQSPSFRLHPLKGNSKGVLVNYGPGELAGSVSVCK